MGKPSDSIADGKGFLSYWKTKINNFKVTEKQYFSNIHDRRRKRYIDVIRFFMFFKCRSNNL